MQAQLVRGNTSQETILTSQQSLQSLHTLLRAGLGCITYLRNLLPADNFSESFLTSANSDSPSRRGLSNSSSFGADSNGRNVSGFKIMTVTRGYTEEADKLMDYLENGIFDALQHQYLRSFVFAIYLDSDDPNNIVEAYTFNFHYYSIPGTSAVVPVMSLGDDLMRMSLSDAHKHVDPISNATKSGRIPTLGEVKKSLKTLIKNLIQATTQMDPLPRRRFATFKLFYRDNTPDDYEPPHFRAGDSEKDRWFFTTHDQGETPEKCSVGTVQTGWHSVDVRVASVSGYLPSVEDNNAPFLGTTTGRGAVAPALTPAEEAVARVQQAEVQRLDASERRVVWDAEDTLGDADIDGEDDPVGGTCEMGQLGQEPTVPIGIRDANGNIVPLPHQPAALDRTDTQNLSPMEGVYIGAPEDVPSHVGQLCQPVSRPDHLEQTQQIDFPGILRPSSPLSPLSPLSTPRAQSPIAKLIVAPELELPSQSLPPSDIGTFSIPSVSSVDLHEPTLETQELENIMIPTDNSQHASEDQVMLDLDTQVVLEADSIESFSNDPVGINSGQEAISRDMSMHDLREQETLLGCECGVMIDDCDLVFCEGPCQKWFHLWCMGYHRIEQVQGDTSFTCFDCRVRADQNWDLIILHDLYPRIMERFQDLALFRRAIKMYEHHSPSGLSAFVKLIKCEAVVAGQLFKRLESEGFIVQEMKEQDGFMETTTRKVKSKEKGKGSTRQSNRLQGPKKYVFVESMKKSQDYIDYFSPDPRVEKRILGLSDLKPKRKKEPLRNASSAQDPATSASLLMRADSVPQDSANIGSVLPRGEDSQTQAEEEPALPPADLVPVPLPVTFPAREEPDKRKHSDTDKHVRTAKRMKISVGLGVDLGD